MADGRAASSQDGACGLNRPDETRRRSAIRIALPPTRLLDTRTPLKSNSLQQFKRRGSGEQPRARLGPSRLWHARIEREERVARLGRVGSG